MLGRFRTTPKNFSRTRSKAVSVKAGLTSMEVLVPTVTSESGLVAEPLVPTLFFFKNAAENPEAKT